MSALPHLRDLSDWQGPVDWKAERREIAACYVKVSQGLTFTSPAGRRRLLNAAWARLPVGGYHYCTPGIGTPERQADRLLDLAPILPGQLRPALDCEANPVRLPPAALAAWYLGAVLRVKQRAGYWPVIYGSPSYLQAFAVYHPDVFGRCPLWLADYGVARPAVPAPWSSFAAWQWTSGYRDPALRSARVDDSYVADLAALRIPVTANPRLWILRGLL